MNASGAHEPAAAGAGSADATPELRAAASGWRWLPLTGAIIVADQLVKLWMVQHFTPFERVHVLPVLDIILTYNTGAAFSVLAESAAWVRWLFVLIALGVSGALILWLRRLHARRNALLACGLALIVGGAIGNMIDRLRLGRVVDFVHVHWGDHYFPAFNVADSAITVGALVLLLDAWSESRAARQAGER
jgi:signal peptidase II